MTIIEGLNDVFDEQARLNQKKRVLGFQVHQTPEEWLALAMEYQEIDSRANFAYCTRKAIALGAKIERNEAEQPEPWWDK